MTKSRGIRGLGFWERVDRSGGSDACWPWTRSCTVKGYGQCWWAGRVQPAHRIAFLLSGGVLTAEKPWTLHDCDNPPCCNPTHLYAGDRADNMRDMVVRGRARGTIAQWNATHSGMITGEDHPQHKLKQSDVDSIRRRLALGYTKRTLAREFHVSDTLIRFIGNGTSWPIRAQMRSVVTREE